MAQTPKRIYEDLRVDEQVTSAELRCEYAALSEFAAFNRSLRH
jgi:hypothetical protein